MFRRIMVAGSFLALAASLAFGADVPPAKLSAEQGEKNIAARGGLQAWRAVQTLSMSGKMQAGGNERPSKSAPGVRTGGGQMPRRPAEQAELPFRMELKRVRKSRLELDFHGQTAIQIYDGANGWKLRPFLNRHEVEPYTADEMKAAALQRVWVDAKAFLETKIEGTPRRLDGKFHPVEVYYRDYKPTNGLLIPYLLETKVQGVSADGEDRD
jgi:hypothetical protein